MEYQSTWGGLDFIANASGPLFTTTTMTLHIDGKKVLGVERRLSTSLWFATLTLLGHKPVWSESGRFHYDGHDIQFELRFVTTFSEQILQIYLNGVPIEDFEKPDEGAASASVHPSGSGVTYNIHVTGNGSVGAIGTEAVGTVEKKSR